jgi:4-hydroxybenzoate polyprenyltransferase
MKRLTKAQAWLIILRPANIMTSVSNALAGLAIAASVTTAPLTAFLNGYWVMIASAFFYAGGIVLNDVFDAKLDAKERPERMIPRGLIRLEDARKVGLILLATGIICAAQYNDLTAGIGLALATAILLYNAKAKHDGLFGPLVMGTCRGLNLLLAIATQHEALHRFWFLPLIYVAYIGAITLSSRGEVFGSRKQPQQLALAIYIAVSLVLGWLGYWRIQRTMMEVWQQLFIPIFWGVFVYMVVPPMFAATRQPKPDTIRAAVRAGVLGIIFLDAAMAAAFGMPVVSVLIVLVYPIVLWMSKRFAVT